MQVYKEEIIIVSVFQKGPLPHTKLDGFAAALKSEYDKEKGNAVARIEDTPEKALKALLEDRWPEFPIEAFAKEWNAADPGIDPIESPQAAIDYGEGTTERAEESDDRAGRLVRAIKREFPNRKIWEHDKACLEDFAERCVKQKQ